MPELLNIKLAAETVAQQCCEQCKRVDAVVQCLDCVPSGTQFLCSACDSIMHRKNVFHDTEAMIDGFFKPIAPPTSLVVVDESGQYQLSEGVFKEFSRSPLIMFSLYVPLYMYSGTI